MLVSCVQRVPRIARGRLDGGVTKDVTERFSDWKTTDGLLLPLGREIWVDGERQAVGETWVGFELPGEIPEREFRRPQASSRGR